MATEMATEMATIRWIGGAVDRAMYSTSSASSELVPTVAFAHKNVGFSSNRETAAPGMLSLADSFEPANKFKQVPTLRPLKIPSLCRVGCTLRSLGAGAERSWCPSG